MSNVPDLRLVLYAGKAEVAHSADHTIWLNTLAAITGVSTAAPVVGPPVGVEPGAPLHQSSPTSGGALQRFAAELEVDVHQLIGAASPSEEAPYVHLDHKYWEALKQNTPPRGVGSVSGVVLSATLLTLWVRHAKFGKVTGAMCDAVLATIGHEERNRARSLKGCAWIQVRDDGLRVDPASTGAAIRLAKAYITKGILT